VQENLREIGPNVMFSRHVSGRTSPRACRSRSWTPPRSSASRSTARCRSARGCRLPLPEEVPGARPAPGYAAAYWGFSARLRDRLGFSAAALGFHRRGGARADTFRFFHALGVNLKQIYARPRFPASRASTARGRQFRLGRQADPGTEIRIAQNGEILFALAERLLRLLQERRGDPPACSSTAGCTPGTPATSPRTAT